ncbi:FecR family protein [Terrimonas alba]|uniref:FecR family protein n=1 Tax=Terrimonas alba TaxID=3349636 RepID=UPI0035F48AC0
MKQPDSLTSQQQQQAERVAYLVSGFLRQSLTEEELDELDAWIVESDDNQMLFEELTDPKNIEAGMRQMEGIDTEKALRKIKSQIKVKEVQPSWRKRHYWTYGIAASLLLATGLFYFNKAGKKNVPAENTSAITDLLPGGNKATLQLADGSIVNLQEQKSGLLKNENGVLINKTNDGQLTYSGTATSPQDIEYNTLVTPKGGQYQVILPDGTRAWLNAASSLKYPVAFTGSERIVELDGEGYFEVAKNAAKPFKVRLRNETEVQVLGTHFNINAYDDEDRIRTTLLEGTVAVSSKKNKLTLAPLQQAVVHNNNEILLDKNANTSAVMAWKNGQFVFKDAPIESVMRQVARWYDVDIDYEGKVTYHFNATIDRNVPVSKLFKLLEMTDNVHFTIKGKKIIVQP